MTVDKILKDVSNEFGIPEERITSREKGERVSEARLLVAYLACKLTNLDTPSIARSLGGRDHYEIIRSRERVVELMGESPVFRRGVDAWCESLS